MRPSNARANEVERTLATILFYLGHRQHERGRSDMERKCTNSDNAQRKNPELKT